MYKLKLTLMSLALLTMTMIVGGSLATMQDRSNDSRQTNQNNSNQNRNSNRGSNINSNSNRNANMNSQMMNSNMMMNSNSGMNMGSMTSGMDTMGLTTIGNMSVEEFMRLNAQGAANVAAVTPNSTALSKSDQKLMMEVAMGGMMQLEISRAALQKVTTPQARLLAQSEVDEQTGLAAKLQQIAAAKGVTLPAAMNSKAQNMIGRMQNMSGAEADRYYVRESGVEGHEQLDKTMSRVESRATDDSLKNLATAAHPMVLAHLQVSRAVLSNMSGNGNNNNRGSANMSGSGNNGGSSMNMNSNSGNTNSNRNRNSNSNRNMNSNGNSNTNSNR